MNVRAQLATAVAVTGMFAVAAAGATATGNDSRSDSQRFAAYLKGYEEVPAVSTRARGSFRGKVTSEGLEWRLRYSGIEGGAVMQAHIHFGQKHVNGGVSAFLCSNLGNAPAGVPPCPQDAADLRGTIGTDDIVGPVAQGIAPGELGELVRAMRSGVAYANVHSTTYPAGEIRGQVYRRR